MNLDEAARAARERADTSTDPAVHALANALESALAAEAQALIRRQFPMEPMDPPPPWSDASEPGTEEGPLPF
jgi:hypothetical protein